MSSRVWFEQHEERNVIISFGAGIVTAEKIEVEDMDEIQQLAAQIKTNPDDVEAWQRLSQLVDDPQKKMDCLNQITRIKNKKHGFIEAGSRQDNISDGGKTTSNRLSITAIVISNLVTIIGVLFWHWDVWSILLLYWLESVVIGFYAILKMILAEVEQPLFHLYKLFIIPFFCVSYGIFCTIAGGFLFMLFMGMGGGIERFAPHVAGPLTLTQVLTVTATNLWQGRPPGMEWFVLGLFTSHGISFAQNYLKREEHTSDTWVNLMAQPYTSIIPLYIAIMISAMPIFIFGSFKPLLIVLVLFKTGINVWQYTNPMRMPRISFSTQWKS